MNLKSQAKVSKTESETGMNKQTGIPLCKAGKLTASKEMLAQSQLSSPSTNIYKDRHFFWHIRNCVLENCTKKDGYRRTRFPKASLTQWI